MDEEIQLVVVEGATEAEDGDRCHLCGEMLEPGEPVVVVDVCAPGTRFDGQTRIFHPDCFIPEEAS